MGHVTVKKNNAPGQSDWQTPPELLALVREVFGGRIDFDPCAAHDNPTKARLFWCPGDPSPRLAGGVWCGPCGLTDPWPIDGAGFINPPWGRHLSDGNKGRPVIDPEHVIMRKGEVVGVGVGWARKIAEHRGESISLVPTRTDAAWFGLLHASRDLRLDWKSPTLGSRLQFIDPDTGETRGGNNSAVTLFYQRPRRARFVEVFAPHGELLPGGRLDWISRVDLAA